MVGSGDQVQPCAQLIDGRATANMKKGTATMKNEKSGSKEASAGDTPSRLIDARIKELGD
jgi:hypothetical protein